MSELGEYPGMSEHIWSRQVSRRGLLRGGAAAATVVAGWPPSSRAAGRPPGVSGANVRVSHDLYGVHVEPSVAANPRHPRQLLAVCQASPTPNPEFIASYLSADGGATWQKGGVPQLPAGANGDDVTVGFDTHGRGYVCATSYAGGRAVFVWRTDDGGRSFSAPVTLVAGQYCDHPWLAVGGGLVPSERNVYVVWGAGAGATGLAFTRSTDGGVSFGAPRTILGAEHPGGGPQHPGGPQVTLSAGPELVAGASGLVCAVCQRATRLDASGDVVGEAVAVCSTDAGHRFAAPVRLGTQSVIIRLPGGVLPNSGATAAAAPDGHSLYVAFTRHRPGAVHQDIVVTASRDAGRTWSDAVVATPDDRVTYFQPNLAVDEAGQVGISAFALANGRVDEVLLVSRPRSLRFYPPLRVTTGPFDPHSPTASGRKHGAWWIGDYQAIVASAGAFHLVWNDTRTGRLELFAATVRP